MGLLARCPELISLVLIHILMQHNALSVTRKRQPLSWAELCICAVLNKGTHQNIYCGILVSVVHGAACRTRPFSDTGISFGSGLFTALRAGDCGIFFVGVCYKNTAGSFHLFLSQLAQGSNSAVSPFTPFAFTTDGAGFNTVCFSGLELFSSFDGSGWLPVANRCKTMVGQMAAQIMVNILSLTPYMSQ